MQQTRRMRTLLAEGKLTDEAIYAIMQEEKPNQKEKFTISASKIEKVIPQSVKASQREDFILKAIDYYAETFAAEKRRKGSVRCSRSIFAVSFPTPQPSDTL